MKNNSSKQKGFLQLIIIVVIFVFIALFFEKNPIEIWQQYIEPLVKLGLDLFLRLINFLITFVTGLMS